MISPKFGCFKGGGATGGGGGDEFKGVAFVDSHYGADDAGDGSAAKPFKTLQAAYDADIVHPANSYQRTFSIVGSVGALTCSAENIKLSFIGVGRELSVVGVVTINGTAPALTIVGNGRQMVTLNNVEVYAANGGNGGDATEAGATGGDGEGGSGAGDLSIQSCYVYGHVYGGSGGNGGKGGNGLNGEKGGSGGNGGGGGSPNNLYITDCEVAGDIIGFGGAGGNGGDGVDGFNNMDGEGNPLQWYAGDGGNGGSAGSGGVNVIERSKIIGQLGSYDGSPGNGGNPGNDAGLTSGSAGSYGSYGSSRNATVRFSDVGYANPGGDCKASILAGTFHGDS